MRILMLSDGERRGGANTAADRLAHGLLGLGQEVVRAVRFTDYERPPWPRVELRSPRHPDLPWDRVPNLAAAADVEAMLGRALDRWRPDVVNVHNLHCAIPSGWSMELVRLCMGRAPVAYTMHDMWSFTGHCPYAFHCRGFEADCRQDCHGLYRYPAPQVGHPPGNLALKREVIAGQGRIMGVTPSRWMREQALSGLWAGREVAVVENGLDLAALSPMDTAQARAELGLEGGQPVLLAASADLDNPAKGFGLLLEALALVERRPVTLLVMGRGGEVAAPEGVTVRALGFVDGEAGLRAAFGAADAYVHPSNMDNLPNTIAEAAACGVPVVALPVGGVPEMVEHGVSGIMAAEATASALAAALDDFLARPRRWPSMGARSRAMAERRWDARRQARAYLDLFHHLASGGAGGPVGGDAA